MLFENKIRQTYQEFAEGKRSCLSCLLWLVLEALILAVLGFFVIAHGCLSCISEVAVR